MKSSYIAISSTAISRSREPPQRRDRFVDAVRQLERRNRAPHLRTALRIACKRDDPCCDPGGIDGNGYDEPEFRGTSDPAGLVGGEWHRDHLLAVRERVDQARTAVARDT